MKALALLVMGLLGGCVQAPSPSPDLSPHTDAAAPVYHVEVQSFTCKSGDSRVGVAVTIKNAGGNEIPYAKAFFRVGNESLDTYLDPSTVPAGALASATRTTTARGDCELVAIQDGDGHPAQITVRPQ